MLGFASLNPSYGALKDFLRAVPEPRSGDPPWR
jgi:hypothetical protein